MSDKPIEATTPKLDPPIHKMVISAPFGNYIQWPYCTPTLGTFTYEYRGNIWYRLWRMARTLRPLPRIRSWVNRLGLPNPGLKTFKEWCQRGTIDINGKIISISARNTEHWEWSLLELRDIFKQFRPYKPAAVQLNVSCPNCGDKDTSDYDEVFSKAYKYLTDEVKVPVEVKLPPVEYKSYVLKAVKANLWGFHCTNTLPTPAGGLSGKALQPIALECVRYCAQYPLPITGGAGITAWDDILRFRDAGATRVAIASGIFNPFNWRRYKDMARKLEEEKWTVSS